MANPQPIRAPTNLDLELRTRKQRKWRNSWSIAELRKHCKARGIFTGPIHHTRILRTMLAKSYSQAIVYEGFSDSDLVKFARLKGVDCQTKGHLVVECLSMASKWTAGRNTPTNNNTVIFNRRKFLEISNLKRLMFAVLWNNHLLEGSQGTGTAQDPLIISEVSPSSTTTATQVRAASKVPTAKTEADSIISARQARSFVIAMLETADQDATFDFLALPLEVRRMVYRLSCKASVTITKTQKQPAITMTNHMVRDEALSVYYTYNHFAIVVGHSPSAAEGPRLIDDNHWLSNCLPRYLSLVRSFSFVSAQHLAILEIDLAASTERINIRQRDYAQVVNVAREVDPGLLLHHIALDREDTLLGRSLPSNVKDRSDLLAAFKSRITSRGTTLLIKELNLAQGFSASSLHALANLLDRTDKFWPRPRIALK